MADLLTVTGISKTFGGVKANRDVCLSVPGAAVRCVVGPNGAGKSTFLSMLAGNTPPDTGKIVFDGQDITSWPVHRVAKLGLVRKFQRPSFYPDLTVEENLAIPVLATGVRTSRVDRVIEDVAEQVRLGDALHMRAAHLPHGRTQWLEIGMLVGRKAKMMLLDEPTAGMTPEETTQTSELIGRLVAENGISAIVIEHDMSFVRSLNCEVTVLHLGEVIAQGPMAQVELDPQVRSVYLGQEFD